MDEVPDQVPQEVPGHVDQHVEIHNMSGEVDRVSLEGSDRTLRDLHSSRVNLQGYNVKYLLQARVLDPYTRVSELQGLGPISRVLEVPTGRTAVEARATLADSTSVDLTRVRLPRVRLHAWLSARLRSRRLRWKQYSCLA